MRKIKLRNSQLGQEHKVKILKVFNGEDIKEGCKLLGEAISKYIFKLELLHSFKFDWGEMLRGSLVSGFSNLWENDTIKLGL